MDRRHLVFASLAVIAAGPAFAQSPSGTPTPSASTPPGTVGPGGNMIGSAEMEHARKTMMVGSLALDTSKIALQKAKDDDVKEFAEFETAEQTTVAEILMQMDSSLKPKLDAKHAAMIEKLQSVKAGKAFDAAYIEGQIDGHKQLLAIQEDYIGTGKSREHITMAKLVRGMVKEHLTLLDDIQSEMKG